MVTSSQLCTGLIIKPRISMKLNTLYISVDTCTLFGKLVLYLYKNKK